MWKTSWPNNQNLEHFRINKVQIEQLEQTAKRLRDKAHSDYAVKHGIADMYLGDACDVDKVLMLFKAGKNEKACKTAEWMDTAPREELPQWVAEVCGSSINENHWNDEESYETTVKAGA